MPSEKPRGREEQESRSSGGGPVTWGAEVTIPGTEPRGTGGLVGLISRGPAFLQRWPCGGGLGDKRQLLPALQAPAPLPAQDTRASGWPERWHRGKPPSPKHGSVPPRGLRTARVPALSPCFGSALPPPAIFPPCLSPGDDRHTKPRPPSSSLPAEGSRHCQPARDPSPGKPPGGPPRTCGS